jgi:hypothetical protein
MCFKNQDEAFARNERNPKPHFLFEVQRSAGYQNCETGEVSNVAASHPEPCTRNLAPGTPHPEPRTRIPDPGTARGIDSLFHRDVTPSRKASSGFGNERRILAIDAVGVVAVTSRETTINE